MADLNIISDLKNRGLKCYDNEQYKEAEELYRTALSMMKTDDPYDLADIYIRLANTYYKLADFDGYIKYYEEYLKLFPEGQLAVFSRLAHAYYFIDTNKSIEYHNRGLDCQFNDYDATCKLFAMIKSSNYSQAEVKTEAEFEINRLKTSVFNDVIKFTHLDKKHPKDKLNIGYLSSDCRSHIMMNYILPIWENHDTSRFNITIYNGSTKSDSTTVRINSIPNFTVVQCANMQISELAEKIYDDKIDILVDLSGYTHLKSMVHLYKPAPIIISYLGYLNTLGMSEVDYILATKTVISEDCANLYVEKPLYLDYGYHIFKPSDNLPEITDCPYETNGYITFGSFNCTSKFSPAILYLWAKILELVPDSKLLIYRTKMTKHVIKRLQKKFTELGINSNRIIYKSTPYTPHFLAYNEADIALDTYPFSGMSICIENELMGVPVITLAGEGLQSRGASSVNSAAGLDEFNANCGEDYITNAVNLAKDKEKLKSLRFSLRDKILNSQICTQYEIFTRNLEDKYFEVWDTFINS